MLEWLLSLVYPTDKSDYDRGWDWATDELFHGADPQELKMRSAWPGHPMYSNFDAGVIHAVREWRVSNGN